MAAPVLAREEAPQGRIETLSRLDAGDRSAPRIRVWLPPGYDRSRRVHRALYMLDGQFVFESDSDGVNFAADRRVARLAAAGTIPADADRRDRQSRG